MTNKVVKHSFDKGLNRDLSKSKLPNNQYWDAKNITISFNQEQNMYSLTNTKGNTSKFYLPILVTNTFGLDSGFTVERYEFSETLQTFDLSDFEITKAQIDASSDKTKIIGYTTIVDTLVLVCTDSSDTSNGIGYIYTVDLSQDTLIPVLKYVNILNFPNKQIDVESNYESSTIQKIYIADSINELRHFNIADTIGYTLTKDQLQLTPNVDLSYITIQSDGKSGFFTAGAVQYAYQYYNLSGAESNLSPLSKLFYIASDNSFGNESTYNTGVNLSFTITGDSNWEYIKVYRIHYTDNVFVPSVNVIYNTSVSSTITINDDGNLDLGSSTIDILKLLNTSTVVPNHLAVKDNRLVVANYDENIYSPDFDVRAYRFPISSSTTIIKDENDVEYTIDATTFQITHENGTPVTNYDIPETHDCINIDNAEQVFSGNMYIAGTTILGAIGPNASITLNQPELILDNDVTSSINVDRGTTSDDIGDLQNNNRSFRRDEIYRLGVVLRDFSGRKSLPKWICDFRMPDWYTINAKYGSTPISGTTEINSTTLEPYVTLGNLPDDCAGAEVVMVKRNESDKTVLSQGYILPTAHNTGGYYVDEYPYVQHSYPFCKLLDPTKYYVFDEVTAANNDFTSGDIVYLASAVEFWECVNTSSDVATLANPDFSLLNGLGSITIDDALSFYSTTKLFSIDNLAPDQTTNTSDEAPSYYNSLDKKLINFFSPEVSFNRDLNVSEDNYLQNCYGAICTVRDYALDADTSLATGMAERPFTEKQYNYFKITDSDLYDNQTYDVNEIDSVRVISSGSSQAYDSKEYNHRIYYGVAGFQYKVATGNNALLIDCTDTYKVSNHMNNALPIVNFKKPLLNQYGGQTYSSRLNNEYISVSDFITSSSGFIRIYGKYGDTFISEFNHILSIPRNDVSGVEGSVGTSVILFLETDINISKRLNKDIANYNAYIGSDESVANKNIWFLDECRELDTNGDYLLYSQNRVYNKVNDTIIDYSLGLGNIQTSFNSSIKISNVKLSSETVDSWLKFSTNNYLDLIGKYGEITAITELNNEIIAFQGRAISHISINPRYQSTTSEGNIILGTGGVLDHYDYITTQYGCSDKYSLLKTPSGLYFWDNKNKKIRLLNSSQALSDIKGVHSYLESINSSDLLLTSNRAISGYDYKLNKCYFTFNHSSTPITIIYDELLSIIEGFIDCNPYIWINTNIGVYSADSFSNLSTTAPSQLYSMNSDTQSLFFGTYYPSYITLLVNDNPDFVKCFNNIELFTEVYDEDNDEILNSSFDYMQVWNAYQDTTELPLTQDSRYSFRFRKWRAIIPRNYKSYNPTILSTTDANNDFLIGDYVINPYTFYLYRVIQDVNNYPLLNDGTVDTDIFQRVTTPLDRIRDAYCFIKLKFTNSGSPLRKFICHDILIHYNI